MEVNVTQTYVYNNYEYKLAKRILKMDYPWILDLVVPPTSELDRWTLIFVNILIDPKIFSETYNVKMLPTTANRYAYLYNIFEMPKHVATSYDDLIQDFFIDLHKNPAIPEELKLPNDRRLGVGEWLINE